MWQVEQDEYCRRVLAKHWPQARRYEDVREVGAHNLDRVDVICGGFPCQGLSVAGPTRSLAGPSSLWIEFERVVSEMLPSWVIIENVHHTWRKWVPSVREALWGRGYHSLPLRLSAGDVGAWHRRRRVFILAHADREPLRVIARRWGGKDGWLEEKPRPVRWKKPSLSRGCDGVPYRVDRARALGNAVVPQVAELVGHVLMGLESSGGR